LGKATSSAVVFFDRKLELGSHLKVMGLWLPIEAYDIDRGRRRVEVSDWRQRTIDVGLCHVSVTPIGFYLSYTGNSRLTEFVCTHVDLFGGRPLQMKVPSKVPGRRIALGSLGRQIPVYPPLCWLHRALHVQIYPILPLPLPQGLHEPCVRPQGVL